MELEFVKYEKRDHLALITLNRPEVMNALHPPCHLEMNRVWDDFVADRELWVAILTGAGERAFSAGNDLKYTAQHGFAQRPAHRGGFAGLTARFDIAKPIIAAVNGFALGGGFEIVLACDLVIAAEHARFGLPEPRVGLAALAGGIHRLPRQIPLKLAMGMMLTGRQISAAEAARLGLVNEVVPLNQLQAAAERWAAEIMECAPLSIQATKEAALAGLQLPLSEAVANRFPAIERLRASQDFVEGPRAFAEKRKPNWRGE
ncbi:MAG TPA: enoyl-CoA hydratase-related protein [Candidatus Binataceae bacterium]|nr:enoyl-CoA hydratase-related protein [Candidatus Binataceae bacterium]